MTLGNILALLGVLAAALALVFAVTGSGPALMIVCGAAILIGIARLIT